MVDIVSQEARSRMMAGIRGKDTKPELLVRRALHARGFRYRLHGTGVPGKPDLIFPKYRAVIFVHGCFWHGHDCSLFRMPETRRDFWSAKILRNKARDLSVELELIASNWRSLTIWECSLRGRHRLGADETLSRAVAWLLEGQENAELRGWA
ncbi:very short patch repair endonuclease [Mesorhizobium sp. M0923]|uniref:very short patch repair endonuclease n=1 Tax=Mesorhizobium sp. M0923 TaxID=2957028 RepID=UPI00333D1062